MQSYWVTFLVILLILSLLYFFLPRDTADDLESDEQQIPRTNERKTPDKPPVDVPVQQKYGSKGEQICCETLSRMFGEPFTTQRPDWLRNPETGRNLEIDCYNENLRLAVEYNGIQHYVYPNRFHKSEEEFLKQVRRDLLKERICQEEAVRLILVPYTIPHEEIESYLYAQFSGA